MNLTCTPKLEKEQIERQKQIIKEKDVTACIYFEKNSVYIDKKDIDYKSLINVIIENGNVYDCINSLKDIEGLEDKEKIMLIKKVYEKGNFRNCTWAFIYSDGLEAKERDMLFDRVFEKSNMGIPSFELILEHTEELTPKQTKRLKETIEEEILDAEALEEEGGTLALR